VFAWVPPPYSSGPYSRDGEVARAARPRPLTRDARTAQLYFGILYQYARDPNPVIRRVTIEYLGRCVKAEDAHLAIIMLSDILRYEQDDGVRNAIAEAIIWIMSRMEYTK